MNNEIIFLSKEQIEVNPLNNWDNGNLKDLIDSIENIGLITPLSVIGPIENGLYRLISGERRYKSICQITENSKENFQIPCYIVGESDMSKEMQCILIETANLEVRETDIRTVNEHRANVMEQLLVLADNKEIKEHNIAAKAAEIFKVSDTYARFWQRIFRKGIPPLKEMVKNGELGIKSANQIARHSEEEQEKAIKEIKEHILPKQEEEKDISDESSETKNPSVTLHDIINNMSSDTGTFEEKEDEVITESVDEDSFEINIDKDVEAEFEAMLSSEKTNEPSVSPKTKTVTSFCNLETFDSFYDSDNYIKEDTPCNSYNNKSYEGDDTEYAEKLNTVLSWCKEIMKKNDLSSEEWHVIEACKDVVDCFM